MKLILPVSAAVALAAPAHAQHGEHGGHQPPPDESRDEPALSSLMLTGALGPYPAGREASGTAWQPESSGHHRVRYAGDWIVMRHATLTGVYDWQQGPRGGDGAYLTGMLMGTARTALAGGKLNLRAMLSPEPLNGRDGYPLHLAAGETANGVTPLVDRQHPHDFFMELSASYSREISPTASLFVYAGLPGDPAFGPPAFMHRGSIAESPEAPITHHWLDSTHISFGVVTAGLTWRAFKAEASRFNGREPDHRRWNIETGPLDSTALRLSWNPTSNLSLQASWARLIAPEQLDPHENSTRWSASAIYTADFGDDNRWSATLAWGNRDGAEAFALEGSISFEPWAVYARAEYAQNEELAGGHHGPRHDVGKVSAGFVRYFPLAPDLQLGIGAQYALNFVPAALEPLYGGDPDGAMTFIRLVLH